MATQQCLYLHRSSFTRIIVSRNNKQCFNYGGLSNVITFTDFHLMRKLMKCSIDNILNAQDKCHHVT